MIDLYSILHISENASPQEIKKAFKKLALQYHPDKHPENKAAEEIFKVINEAYSVLSDPQKKMYYDAQRQYQSYLSSQNQSTHTSPYFHQSYSQSPSYSHETNYEAGSSTYEQRLKQERQTTRIIFLSILSFILISVFFSMGMEYHRMRKIEKMSAQKDIIFKEINSYVSHRNFSSALHDVDSIITSVPEFSDAILLKTQILDSLANYTDSLFKVNEYGQVVESISIIEDYDPNMDYKWLIKRSKCQQLQGDYIQALNTLYILINKKPQNLDAHNEIASIMFYQFNQKDIGLRYMDRATELIVEDYEKKYGKAYAILVPPQKTPELHYQIFLKKAEMYFELERYKASLEALDWALYLRPEAVDPIILKGKNLANLGEAKKACNLWKEARNKGSLESIHLIELHCR
ncbi:J domain-containing protein [Sediminitomix flava]|uniref:DnaJ-like protein n=1 Tax=Sediminitomix flava TaxID=379075 RepID=A0A315ZDI3_SEDFL|nr:J domain-containing protein [Sediminitomix flava]PWJ42784.1 DnaJ-like protein [Sediminitomix flava]